MDAGLRWQRQQPDSRVMRGEVVGPSRPHHDRATHLTVLTGFATFTANEFLLSLRMTRDLAAGCHRQPHLFPTWWLKRYRQGHA